MSDKNGVENQLEMDDKHDGEEKVLSEKANEYIRELVGEKHGLDTHKNPNAARLLDQGRLVISIINLFILLYLKHSCLTFKASSLYSEHFNILQITHLFFL